MEYQCAETQARRFLLRNKSDRGKIQKLEEKFRDEFLYEISIKFVLFYRLWPYTH